MPYQTLTESTLRALVDAQFPGQGAHATIEPTPTGKHNNSYFVGLNGREVVLRVAPPPDVGLLFYERNMMAQEPAIHALVGSRTSVPIPPVLAYDDSHSIVATDCLFLARLPGEPASDVESLAQGQWHTVLREVGRCLRETHALHGEAYGYVGAHRPMTPQATWADAFAVMWELLVRQVVEVGGYSEAEGAVMLDRHRARLLDKPWSRP